MTISSPLAILLTQARASSLLLSPSQSKPCEGCMHSGDMPASVPCCRMALADVALASKQHLMLEHPYGLRAAALPSAFAGVICVGDEPVGVICLFLLQRWIRPAAQMRRQHDSDAQQLLPQHDVWDPGAAGASPDAERAALLTAAEAHRHVPFNPAHPTDTQLRFHSPLWLYYPCCVDSDIDCFFQTVKARQLPCQQGRACIAGIPVVA